MKFHMNIPLDHESWIIEINNHVHKHLTTIYIANDAKENQQIQQIHKNEYKLK